MPWFPEGVTKLVHANGVNVRKLGVLRAYLPEHAPVSRLILSEMASRVIKNHIRHIMRTHKLLGRLAPCPTALVGVE